MNDEENILSPDELKEDYENTLRPKSIDEFIGQADLKKKPEDFFRSIQNTKKSIRPRSFSWSSWFGKNNIGTDYCEGIRGKF